MAHLEVKPKSRTPWWLWLLLVLIILAALFYFFKGRSTETKAVVTTDSTSTTTTDTISGQQAVAATEPDWNSVDFNAPKSADGDVTDQDIQVSGNDKYTIYSLGENILFAKDQNTIQGSADAKLKEIVTSLNKRFKGANIGVFGNTDSTGTAGHNKEVGAERASAVKEWLTKNGGIDETRVSVHSYGEKEPIASNATAKGREQNRNVEIVAFPGTTVQ